MSTQEHSAPFSLAQLLIELSGDLEKREQFQRDPAPFLANGNFSDEQIDALLSRNPAAVRQAFGLAAGGPGEDGGNIQPQKAPKKKKKTVPKKKKTTKAPAKKKTRPKK